MKKLVLPAALLGFLFSGAVFAEELVLDTPTGPLAGSLMIPTGEGPWPVVLILAGSGPTDRDGNSTMFPGRNNSLKQLAEGLSEAGVASLRVDKRGVAISRPAALAEIDLTLDVFIDDAVRWCKRLRSDDRFSSVAVAGHSQGAQVGGPTPTGSPRSRDRVGRSSKSFVNSSPPSCRSVPGCRPTGCSTNSLSAAPSRKFPRGSR